MKSKFKKLFGFIKRHKWSFLLVILFLSVATFFLWDSFSAGITNPADIVIKKKPKIEKVRAPLSGRLVEKEKAEKKTDCCCY